MRAVTAIVRRDGSSDRTAKIIALANSVDLLKPQIGKDLVEERKERIANIVSDNVMGDATREANRSGDRSDDRDDGGGDSRHGGSDSVVTTRLCV